MNKTKITEEDIKWIFDYFQQNTYYKNPFIPIFGYDEDDTTNLEKNTKDLLPPIVENIKYLFDNPLSHLYENLYEFEELDLKFPITLPCKSISPHISKTIVPITQPNQIKCIVATIYEPLALLGNLNALPQGDY